MLRALYGTKKVVGHIDLRYGDTVTSWDIDRALLAKKVSHSGDFDQVLEQYKKAATQASHLQTQREQIMIERFESEIGELIEARPELKEKQNINILFSLGAAHTPLFHDFKQKGVDTERAFSHQPFTYSFRSEVDRVVDFGVEPTRDLLAKTYLEQEFRNALKNNAPQERWPDTHEQTFYLRQITSVFSTEEIKEIYDQTCTEGEATVERVNQLLQTKGLDRLPTNADQLHAILERQKAAEKKSKIAKIKKN